MTQQTSRPSHTTPVRATSTDLDAILGQEFAVLDHGFIRVVDYMGNDDAIVQAARVSYGRGTKTPSADASLIRYLMRHSHTTPFEMCEIKLHVKLPIFVARQWIRHRTASVNEYSARYSVLDREFYIPARENLAPQSTLNRQGRSDFLSDDEAEQILTILRGDSLRSYESYLELLNETEAGGARNPGRLGLSRELARMNLSVNFYTQWYWKIDLHNLLHFLKLRADPHAQLEIRLYAKEILKILRLWVPLTVHAFEEYRLNAIDLSATALTVVRRMIAGERVTAENSGLGKREWDELMAHLKGPDR